MHGMEFGVHLDVVYYTQETPVTFIDKFTMDGTILCTISLENYVSTLKWVDLNSAGLPPFLL